VEKKIKVKVKSAPKTTRTRRAPRTTATSRAARSSPTLLPRPPVALRGGGPRSKKERRKLEVLGATSVGVFSILVMLLFGASSIPHYAMRSPQVAAVVSSVMVDLANGDRVSNNLPVLKINPELVAAAQAKANDMAARGYFAHVAPDGTDPWHWFAEAGYAFDYAGENLAIDFSDSGDVEKAWMNSPTHRENILSAHFTEIGIASAVGMYQGRMTTFVVQEFGSPSIASATEGAPKGIYDTQTANAVVPENPTQPAFARQEPASARQGPAITTAQKALAVQVATKPESKPSVAQAREGKQVLGTSVQEVAVSAPIAQNATRQIVEDAAPATAIDPAPASEKPPLWAYMIGVPHAALEYAYYFLTLLVLVMLAFTTRLEFHRHHTRHAAGAGFLLGLMGTLLIVAHFTIFAQPVLAAVMTN